MTKKLKAFMQIQLLFLFNNRDSYPFYYDTVNVPEDFLRLLRRACTGSQ